MKVRHSIRVLVTFRQCYGEDAVVPAKPQPVDIVIPLQRVHVEEVVREAVRSVFVEIVNHDLGGFKIWNVGEGISSAINNVHRNVGETETAPCDTRRNLMSTHNVISLQINHPD